MTVKYITRLVNLEQSDYWIVSENILDRNRLLSETSLISSHCSAFLCLGS
jgi:hypothetical protein